MASKQIKIGKGIHHKVKEYVDSSDLYTSYKSFYEDAVREKLATEKQELTENEKESIREFVKELEDSS